MKEQFKGKYLFTIGGLEKDCYRNINLEDSKYLGRFKTLNKYLVALFIFDVYMYSKETLNDEVDLEFFKKYSDYITGDVFYIEKEEIWDKLECINIKKSVKKIINVQNIKTNEKIKTICYFNNTNNLEESIKNALKIINEYSIDDKIKAQEVLFEMGVIKGDKSMEEFFEKIDKLKNI